MSTDRHDPQPVTVATATVVARTVPDLATLAKIGFEAYNAHAGGKTFDGRPIPPWDAIRAQGSPVCGHWEAAVDAILAAVGFTTLTGGTASDLSGLCPTCVDLDARGIRDPEARSNAHAGPTTVDAQARRDDDF